MASDPAIPAEGMSLLGRSVLGAQPPLGLPTLSVLSPSDWSVLQAVDGDRGISSGGLAQGELELTPVSDSGRVHVVIRAIAAGSGEWGIYLGLAESDMDPGVLGAAATLAGTPVALGNYRQYLGFSSRPWVQAFYRAAQGSGAWLVASMPRQVALTGRSPTLALTDFTVEPFALDGTTIGLRIPRTGLLSSASRLWYTTATSNNAPNRFPAAWTEALLSAPEDETGQPVDGAGHFYLDTLDGAPGASTSNLQVIYRSRGEKNSGQSPTQTVTRPGAPAAMTSAHAALVDGARPSGDRLLLRITGLPVSGLPLTRIEVETATESGPWGGGIVLDPSVQEIEITTTGAGVPGRVRVRARNGLDAAPAWLELGPVTPTTNTASINIVLTPGDAVAVGQAVHGKVSPTSINGLAAAAGVSMAEFEATSETFWEYSTGDARENYPFEGLPADHLGGKTAGWALGRFGAHVYAHPGTHTIRVSIYRLGVLVAQGTREVTVSWREYAVAAQGYLAETLPVAGADGVPAGVTNLFTDVNAAFAWLCGGSARALYVRRGDEFLLTLGSSRNLPTDATLGAYDASGPHGATGARPVVNVDFGIDGARIDAIATGGTQAFTGDTLGAEIYVYADNTRLVEGTGYTRGVDSASNTITVIDAAPGARIRVLNVNSSTGRPTISTNAVFRLGGNTRQIIRDIDILGTYDPVNPGSFDYNDLSTLNYAAQTSGIITGTGDVNNATLFRCSVRYFGENFTFGAGAGNMLALVDVNFSHWANYGIFVSKITRYIQVGCDICQHRLAANGAQAKAFNTPIHRVWNPALPFEAGENDPARALNAPWHGPIRVAYCYEVVIDACRMDSRTSWAGGEPDRAQPVARLVQSGKPGQSYSYTRCHTSGGQGVFNGGSKNGLDVQSNSGLCYVGYNVFVGYPPAGGFAGGSILVTSISNLYLIPEGYATIGFDIFSGQTVSTRMAQADLSTAPWRSINDTILVVDNRPGAALRINPPYTLASAGMQNIYSVVAAFPPGTEKGDRPNAGGYPVPPEAWGTPTVRVPLNISSNAAVAGIASRFWRGTSMANADAADFVSIQRTIYDFQFQGLAPNVDVSERTQKDIEWVDLTLKSGVWGSGDVVWLTREMTLETLGQIEFGDPDEGEGEEVDDTLVFGTPETFVPNNRTEDLIRPSATLHNTLVLVEGTWASFYIDGASADPTPYRMAAYGAFDAHGRPQTGNTAIDAATGVRAAFDLRGRLRTGNSLGALEPDSLDGLIPVTPAVSLALSPATYTEGDAFAAANVAATIDTAGEPPLTQDDIIKTPEVLDAQGALVSTTGSASLVAGQRVRGRIRWAHQTLPVQDEDTNPVEVAGAAFAPIWIHSNPDLAAAANTARNGARIYRTGLPTPDAAENQHIGFRLRSRHNAALANGHTRLFESGNFSIRLDAAGLLTVRNSTTNWTVGTVPTSNGLVSLLVSSYRAGDGPGGAFMRFQVKIDDGPVVTTTFGTAPVALFGTAFRIFTAAQGTGDVDFQQFHGLWLGGVPDWSDLFQADGAVRNWAADLTLGVAGMDVFSLLNGVGGASVDGTFEGHRETLARPWVEAAPPVAVSFGDHTLAGFGGYPAPAGATAIVGLTGYTLASGRVAPTSTGSATAGLMRFTGSGETWDVTVQANRWDVRTHAEMLETLAHASLAYGDDVRLRAGTYDTTETYASSNRVRRSTAINGTFTAPSDYGIAGTVGWYQGPDLDTGNYVRIRPDAGTVTITGTLQVDSQLASNLDGLRFSELDFAPDAYFLLSHGADHIATDNFRRESADPPVDWASGETVPAGLKPLVQVGTDANYFKAIDHYVAESDYAVRFSGNSTGIDVIGLQSRRAWGDGVQLNAGCSNARIGWNFITDKQDGPPEAELHGDFIQVNGDGDNIVTYCNILTRGNGYSGRLDGQGVFYSGNTVARTGTKIFGNIIQNSLGRGISPGDSTDPLVAYNTVVTHSVAPYPIGVIWDEDALNSGGLFYGNAADTFNLDDDATSANNADLDAANRAVDFAAPSESIDVIADLPGFLAAYTPKAGGALDAAQDRGAVGRFDYVNRTFDVSLIQPITMTATVERDGASITITPTTDVGAGTLYWLISTSPVTPDGVVAQGTAAAKGTVTVTATGAQTPIVASGLDAGATYYVGVIQTSGGRVSAVTLSEFVGTASIFDFTVTPEANRGTPSTITDGWQVVNSTNIQFGGYLNWQDADALAAGVSYKITLTFETTFASGTYTVVASSSTGLTSPRGLNQAITPVANTPATYEFTFTPTDATADWIGVRVTGAAATAQTWRVTNITVVPA